VEGRHYVLIGCNGTGKSTLLKVTADDLVPGIPRSTRILLWGQPRETNLNGDLDGMSLEADTVLQQVVRSDRVRERYLQEHKMLSGAFKRSVDVIASGGI
jgi:ATP-binding cassette subfamily F protein 3